MDPGDEVILAEPTYVAYVPDIVFAGATPVFVPTRLEDGWQLDPDAVEAAITPRTKALFLGFPNNPTGAVLDGDRLRALAAIAERHDLIVISDEIYDRLVYGGHRHEAFSALPGMRDRTILLGGFSKAYAMTGWRIGYACAPADLLDGIVKVHQYIIMSAPTIAQDAALVALDRRRRRTSSGWSPSTTADGACSWPACERLGLATAEPRGAFYAFPSIAASGLSSEEFSERLLFEHRRRGHPRQRLRAAAARATCAPRWRPPTRSSRRRCVRIERFLGAL